MNQYLQKQNKENCTVELSQEYQDSQFSHRFNKGISFFSVVKLCIRVPPAV